MAAGSPIRITILANARDAIRGLNRAAKAVQSFDKQARKSTTGLRAFGKEFSGLGKIAGKATAGLKVAGKAIGVSLMGFVALGVASGTAQVASALTAGLLATLPALGVLPGFALLAASAMTVLKVATSGVAEAMKTGLAAAASGSKTDIKAYEKAMDRLAPSVQATVRELVSLQPALIGVRNAIAGKFFSGFASEIKSLTGTYLPLLAGHGIKVAAAFNKAALGVGAFLRKGSTVDTFAVILTNVRKAIDNIAAGLPNLVRGFLPLISVSTSFLPGLTSGFGNVTKKFAAFMEEAEKSGALKTFIQGGLQALKALMGILGDVGGILKSVFVDANAGAGSFFTVIGTVLDQVDKFLNTKAGMDAIGAVWDILGGIGAALGDTLGIVLPQLGAALVAIAPAIGPLADALGDFLANLSPILPVVGALAAVLADNLTKALPILAPAMLAVGKAIGSLLTAAAPLLPVIAEVAAVIGTALADAVTTLMPSLTPFITALGGALVTAANAIAPLLPAIAAAFGQLLTSITPLLPSIAGLVTSVASGLLPHIGPLTTLILGLVVAFKAYKIAVALSAAAQDAFSLAGKAVKTIKDLELATKLKTATDRIATAATNLYKSAIVQNSIVQVRAAAAAVAARVATLAQAVASGVAAAAMAVIRGATIAWTAVQWLLNAAFIASPIGLIVIGIVALIAIVVLIATKTQFFQTVWAVCWGAIKSAAVAVFNFLKSYFVGMFKIYRAIFFAGVDAFKAIWRGILAIVDNVKQFGSSIIDVLSNFLDFILKLPGRIIDGFVNGLKAGWGKVTGFFDGAVALIPKGIRSILGINSPSKVMATIGGQIGKGLTGGIQSQLPAIRRVMDTVSGVVSGGVATNAAVKVRADATLTGAGTGSAGGVLPQFVINNYNATGVDPSEVGRATVAAIEAWQKRTGRQRLLAA